MGWRKATWAIVLWTALAGFMLWGIVEGADRATAVSERDPALTALAAGLTGMGVLAVWWMGFLVLVLIWFMSRPTAGVVVYGPRGEQAMVTEREAKRRIRRGWSYTARDQPIESASASVARRARD